MATKQILTVMQKRTDELCPRQIKTSDRFIAEMFKYGYFTHRDFPPVARVSLMVETGTRPRNFSLESEELTGTVMFYGGTKGKASSLTEEQMKDICEWFMEVDR